jgi:hypothetical protein
MAIAACHWQYLFSLFNLHLRFKLLLVYCLKMSIKRVGVLCLCGQGARLLFHESLQYVMLGHYLLHNMRVSSTIIQPTTIVPRTVLVRRLLAL